MASNIINLNELVPGLEGKTFKINDAEYKVPGDLPSETVFEFLALFDDLSRFQVEASKIDIKDAGAALKVRETLAKINGAIEAKMLDVFRIETPDLEKLPFGSQSTTVVLGEILQMMGLASPVEPEVVDPPTPPRRRSTTRTTTSSRSRKATSRKPRSK